MIHYRRQWPNTRISRRNFLLSAAALGEASRRSVHAQERDPANVLRLLCWGGYDDEEVTRTFREQTGFAIEATHIGANDEIFLKLRAGGLGSYDLVTPQNGVVEPLIDVDLIQPLDLDRLPNTENYLPRFQRPDWSIVGDQVYAAPMLWGAAPMVYNADALADPPEAWLDLQSPDYHGQLAMHDDGLGHFKIWNRALGAEDPIRVTREMLASTTEILMSIKSQQVITFSADMTAIAAALADGVATSSTIGWEAVPWMPAAEDANLQLAYPQPGSFSFCESFCLAKDAPNLDAAYAFIDYMLTPEAQAKAAAAKVLGPVTGPAIPLLDPEIRALHPYDDLDPFFDLNPLLGFPPTHDDGSGIATYTDWVNSWERVRYERMEAE